MDKRCVVICDSGIGGLRLLKKLSYRFPNENFVYFADYKNLPYGEKTKVELCEIAEQNYQKALAFSPKLIVFACNTLSTNVLPFTKTKNVLVTGVFPKVEEGRGLLLCTPGTAKSKFVEGLKTRYLNLEVVGLDGFATRIENVARGDGNYAFKEVERFRNSSYDFVSLGCTHYPFAIRYLQEIFKNTPFLSGENQTFVKIENFLTTNDNAGGVGSVSFVGEDSKFLKSLYFKGNFNCN